MQRDQNNFRERYRAISWWLTYDDFRWPDLDIADKIRWKADNMAKNGVNMAIIFGAHWRWDWMPVWTMLHDLIATMADELHQRNIKLFDHHSAVLAQRYNTREELRELRKRHPHHISPAPTFAAGASWEYKGQKLDDWCMRNVTDGKVNYLPMYQTVEFCINNPGFVEAYLDYAKTLFAETNIDGFNCDDGFYYAGFKSCGCEHCRRMFRENYGYELPPADDLTFWGNWDNEAWRRWVDMRHESAGAFLQKVREVIPANAGLCTCLSGSVNSSGNGTGQGFPMVEACNVLMIEMTKNMPDLNGKAYGPLPTQLYQIALKQLQYKEDPSLTLICPDTEGIPMMLSQLQKQWHETLGVFINIEPLDLPTLQSRIAARDYDLALCPVKAAYDSPEAILTQLFGAGSLTGWEDSQLNLQMTQANRSATTAYSAASYLSAEKSLVQSGIAIPLYYETSYYVTAAEVSGLHFSPFGCHVFFSEGRK